MNTRQLCLCLRRMRVCEACARILLFGGARPPLHNYCGGNWPPPAPPPLSYSYATLNEHAKQVTHLKAVASMAEAEYRFNHCAPSINQQLTSQASHIMSQYKAKLISIMKTVVFLQSKTLLSEVIIMRVE